MAITTKVTFSKWNTKEVKRKVVEQLVVGADMAGKFVEDEARKNLLGISTPSDKRNVNYRNYVSRLITHEVTAERGAIVVRIGPMIAKNRLHGWYIETGSSTAGAHPWCRPALFNNLGTVIGILTGQ